MAEKLSIRIQLEGAKEIEAQLESLGDAGKQAFVELSKEAEKTGRKLDQVKPEEITKKIEELGVKGEGAFEKIGAALSKASGIKDFAGQVQVAEDAMSKFGLSATKALGPIGGIARMLGPIGISLAAVASGLVYFGGAAIKTAADISKVTAEAAKLGLTLEQFKQLQVGIGQLGAAWEDASKGIAQLGSAIDKLKVAEVKQDLDALNEGIKLGYGIQGTESLLRLKAAAEGVGPAAKAARAALEQLGVGVAAGIDPVAEALKRLGISALDTARAFPVIRDVLLQMPDNANRTALALEYLGDAGLAVVGKISPITAELNKLNAEWQKQQQQQPSQAMLFFLEMMNAALIKHGEIVQQEMAEADEAYKRNQSILGQLFQAITGYAATDVWGAFKQSAIEFGEAAVTSFNMVANAGVAAWNAISGAVQTAIGWIQKAIGGMKEMFGMGGGEAGAAPSVGAFAGGGLTGGRGTGTSDSNLAWLSRGEYITPARAVRQPGVLSFLEALRRSGGNLTRVLDGMGHFALGGMVRSPLPAFAAGGLNGGSNVTIQFPGLPAIGGLRASTQVVDELRKAAALAQVRSGGRKPSRYS